MSREAFLARVRAAAAAGRAYRVKLVDPMPPGVGYLGAGDDPLERMAAEVTAVGGAAHVVADLVEARSKLATLLSEVGARRALCWRHDVLDRLGLAVLLGQQGVERLDFASLQPIEANERRQQMLAADVGISSVHSAIAETGTLVVASMPGQERLASLLPPVHVAIVERRQIVPDLYDLFEQLQAAGLDKLPSNLALITGPSKTGDIELTLTTGVHGPGIWHVILVN